MKSINKLFILFLILVSSPLLAQFSVDVNSGCDTLTVKLSDLSGSTTWNWNFGDGNTASGISNPTHFFADSGSYTITLIADAGTFTKNVVVHESPNVDYDFDTVYYASFTIKFRNTSELFSPIDVYVWNYGDNTANDTIVQRAYKYQGEGLYPVKLYAKDAYGCTDSISKNINVKHKFIVPNAFTPNADNINDRFIVLSNGFDIFPEAVFYNRWGSIVFRRQSVAQVIWDGRTFDGSLVAPGTYFYVITLPESTNNDYPDSKNIKGTVQVLYDRKTLK